MARSLFPRRRTLVCLCGALAVLASATTPAHAAASAAAKPAAPAAKPAAKAAAPAAPGAAAATALPAGVQKVASVEGITEYRLANGLRVLLFPDDSKSTITVNVTYMVGSKNEGYGETGMAHLLEHLMFKGSTKHPAIHKELTDHGARPNGSTWYDRTNYFETFNASDENLDWALDLEADRMVHSFIAQKDLDSEMTVVRNEFEVDENQPSRVLMERMLSTAYLWHAYGKSPIGDRSDIEHVPIENLQAFYRRYYQPDDALLVVAGRIDPAATLRKVAAAFGPIPRPQRALPVAWTEEPAQDGERLVTLRRVGDVQVVGAVYHVPAGSDPQFAAVAVLAQVLGDSPSGRLYHALVETQKASDVGGFPFQLEKPGTLYLTAEVRKGSSAQEALDTLLQETENLASKPVTDAEVERARQALLKEWDTEMRDSQRAALGLSEWQAMGDWRLMFLQRDRLEKVTTADVQRVAATYLRRENRTAGLYLPTDAAARVAVPPAPDVAAMVKDYKGREALAEGEVFDASPAAIEARTVRQHVEPGIDLVMVPKKTRGDLVRVSLAFDLGNLEALQGKSRVAEMTAAMLERGTALRNRQQLRDDLDRYRAQLGITGGPTSVAARLEVPREHLADALRLVAEELRQPAFAASELTLLQQEDLAQLEKQRQDPNSIGFLTLYRHLRDYPAADPRHVATPDEDIAETRKVTVDDLKRFHADFYGASSARVAAVGAFEPQELAKLVGELFGGWSSKTAYVRVPSPYQEHAAAAEVVPTPDKEGAIFTAGFTMPVQDTDPDYPALVLGNFMTGGGFISSRVANRLRQKEGLSYGAGTTFNASPWEPNATFLSYAIYAPQNVERLEKAYREEMDKIVQSGFTADEVEAAKKGWLQRQQVSRTQEAELAGRLSSLQMVHRTLAWDAQLEKAVVALTPEQVNAAVKKHFDLGRLQVVKAGDFTKKAEAAPAAPATPGAQGQTGTGAEKKSESGKPSGSGSR